MPDPISAISGGSALLGASSASKAAKAQTRAADQQTALQRQIYDETSANFEPYRAGGPDYVNALRYEVLGGDRPMIGATDGQGGTPYGGYEMSNGYKFQLDQGQRAIDNSAASSGGLFSGATLKAQQQFGQGIAAQGYDNYLNRLTQGAASGQAAAGNQANAGANYAAGAGQAIAGAGNAQAAGAIGVGNALQNGLSNGIGLYNYMGQQSAGTSQPQSASIFSKPWGSGGFWG